MWSLVTSCSLGHLHRSPSWEGQAPCHRPCGPTMFQAPSDITVAGPRSLLVSSSVMMVFFSVTVPAISATFWTSPSITWAGWGPRWAAWEVFTSTTVIYIAYLPPDQLVSPVLPWHQRRPISEHVTSGSWGCEALESKKTHRLTWTLPSNCFLLRCREKICCIY